MVSTVDKGKLKAGGLHVASAIAFSLVELGHIRSRRCLSFSLVFALLLTPSLWGATVELTVNPVFAGEPLQLASLRYDTNAKEPFSITRLSFLASGFAFQRDDGSWLEVTNKVAWFDADKGRLSTRMDVATGVYRSIRFEIGLPSHLNHADVAGLTPDDPLNPNVNGLHWSWQGGYVFLAVEGMWRRDGLFDGWSYHLARDTNRTGVVIPAAFQLTTSARLEIAFDIATLLNAPHSLSFGRDGSSTHSRDGDPLAAALKVNLAGAFSVRGLITDEALQAASPARKPLHMPAVFTPYRFAISAAFPVPDLPRDNPLIAERVALGEKLFREKLLSRDNSISCASCHDAAAAFADPRRFSTGVGDRAGTRNAMPLVNLAWKSAFFWDGRAPSLRAQALVPIQDHAEMDESLTNVATKLAAAKYSEGFLSAFGSPEVTAEKIGLALEQFLLTLTSFDARFDRIIRGEEAFTATEKRGFELFMTEYDPRRGQFGADCFHCHGGPLFCSQPFANNGLNDVFADRGRAKVTGRPADEGKFATPSLRNVALTAPYMHDGRFATLEEVVDHYATGVKRSATLDPNLAKHPNGGVPLNASDKKALVAFLKTLTDRRFIAQAQSR